MVEKGQLCRPFMLEHADRPNVAVRSRAARRRDFCLVRGKPFPAFPAVFRPGNQHIHVSCWTGEKRTEKPTMDRDNPTWRVNEGERAA